MLVSVILQSFPCFTERCGCDSVFHRYYHAPTLANGSKEDFPVGGDLLGGNRSEVAAGLALNVLPESFIQCTRERPVLCLLLMLGTLWMGYTLYQFKRRYVPYLSAAALFKINHWRSLNGVWTGALLARTITAEWALTLKTVSSDRACRNSPEGLLQSSLFC